MRLFLLSGRGGRDLNNCPSPCRYVIAVFSALLTPAMTTEIFVSYYHCLYTLILVNSGTRGLGQLSFNHCENVAIFTFYPFLIFIYPVTIFPGKPFSLKKNVTKILSMVIFEPNQLVSFLTFSRQRCWTFLYEYINDSLMNSKG